MRVMTAVHRPVAFGASPSWDGMSAPTLLAGWRGRRLTSGRGLGAGSQFVADMHGGGGQLGGEGQPDHPEQDAKGGELLLPPPRAVPCPNTPPTMPGRSHSDGRTDAHSSSAPDIRSASALAVRRLRSSTAGHRSPPRSRAASPQRRSRTVDRRHVVGDVHSSYFPRVGCVRALKWSRRVGRPAQISGAER